MQQTGPFCSSPILRLNTKNEHRKKGHGSALFTKNGLTFLHVPTMYDNNYKSK